MNTLLFDSLEIRQFRAFDFLKIEQLGHVNLILGKNNVGKSTLLEALYLHANVGSPSAMRHILDTRNEPYSSLYTEQSEPGFNNLFFGNPLLADINQEIQIGRLGAPDSSLRIFVTCVPMKLTMHDATTLIPKSDGIMKNDTVPAIQIGGIVDSDYILPLDRSYDDLTRFWNLQKEHVEMITPGIFIHPDGLSAVQLQTLWETIALKPEKQDVIDALRIISPEVEDFVLFSPRPGVQAFNVRIRSHNVPVPARSLGDGINRLIGLSMALVFSKGGILLVDEIENGIHWSVLPYVWKFIVKVAKRLNVQVFATTHSNDCLRAFHYGTKGEPEVQGVAVRLEKRDDGFHAEIFDEQRLALIVKEGIEIR
ncbi:MAG: AAA family ATPase [Desulfovibrio sp.]|nr:AAA family ATPase [Desulfovibrio sp.]